MASQCNDLVDTRNKRSVWMIPTRAFKGAHFATFPEGLPVDPIKSSSREGDWTLDPFAGAGTVGVVSARLGRNHVGIDANPDYVRNIAAPRLRNDAPLLIDVEVHT